MREQILSDDGHVRVVSTQEVDGIIDFVKDAPGQFKKGADQHYVGSVPILVCQIWAKECGAAIGTAEWKAYAYKKLKSGEFAKFQVKLK